MVAAFERPLSPTTTPGTSFMVSNIDGWRTCKGVK
jgi:hypothetical protein